MGFPLGPTFANIFLIYLEQIWLKNCPCESKLVIYKRYVECTFLLFRSKDHIKKFPCYLNCQHASNKFTSEIEQSILYPFSMLELQRLTIVFFTCIYCKVTFNGVFTDFKSFLLYLSYK